MQEILLKVLWKRMIKNPSKSKLYFFFWNQSFIMNKVIKNKRDLELVLSCSSGYQKSSFISYILSDQVWWCNTKRLLSYFENCICKFMQTSSWHHKLLYFHLSFFIWKVWKGREQIAKVWIVWGQKELFWWNNKQFS